MTSDPFIQRRVGAALKELRDAADLGQTDAAKVIGADRTAISRIESGKRKVRPLELAALLDFYAAPAAARKRIEALAERRGDKGWWTRYLSVLTKEHREYIGLEAAADEIWDWSPVAVPGHLQTADYGRALMRGMGLPDDQAEQLVDVRLQRQRQLALSRPRICSVLDESLLHRVVGGPEVMAAQCQQMIAAARQPRTTIQIVPYNRGDAAVGVGGFSILTYADGWQVVWGDTVAGDSCMEEDRPERCVLAFDRLRSSALSQEASLARLQEALERSAS